MKKALIVAGALAIAPAGCVGPNPYRNIDLNSDLPPSDLKRYQSEARAAGGPGVVEKTDLWPLGLLLYWKKGVVRVGRSPSGEATYHVTNIEGFGPLALLFAIETNAVFDANGRRLATASGASVLWGHLTMVHTSDIVLPGGRSRRMMKFHLPHHIVNVRKMGRRTTVSFLSAPNPLSFEFSSD